MKKILILLGKDRRKKRGEKKNYSYIFVQRWWETNERFVNRIVRKTNPNSGCEFCFFMDQPTTRNFIDLTALRFFTNSIFRYYFNGNWPMVKRSQK